MNYLLKFTIELQRTVSGYSILDAERGYKAALKELRHCYGHLKKALDLPPVKPDGAKTLNQFAIFLRECQYAVENIDACLVQEL